MPQFVIQPPFTGLNTRDDPSLIKETEAVVATNLTLEKGTLKTRDGCTLRTSVGGDGDLDHEPRLIYGHRLEDGSKAVIYLTASANKIFREVIGASSGELTKVGTALDTPTTVPQAVTFAGRVYITNEITNGGQFTAVGPDYAGTFTAFDANLPVPTNLTATYVSIDSDGATDLTWVKDNSVFSEKLSGGAGNTDASELIGRYSWKATFYSQGWDLESAASELARPTTNDGFAIEGFRMARINVANLVNARSDKRITHINLYRKRESSSQFEWHFVRRVKLNDGSPESDLADGSQRVYDNTPNEEVSITKIAPFSVFNDHTFTNGSEDVDGEGGDIALRTLEVHGNVMFAGGIDNRLWFSKPDKPGIFNENIRVGGGDPITGIESFNGMLYIFTERDIYTLDGFSKNSFNLKRKIKGTGCAVIGSIVPTENGIYFWSDNAVFAFDGEGVVNLSDPIKDKIEGRHKASDNKVMAGWDKEKGCVFWPLYSDATNQTILVLEYRNARAAKQPSWVEWKHRNSTTILMTAVDQIDKDGGGTDLVYGFNNDLIYNRGGLKDEVPGGGTDVTIQSQWKTGQMHAGEPGMQKNWGTIEMHFAERASGDTASLTSTASGDGTDYATDPQSVVTHLPVAFNRIRRHGRELMLDFTHTAANAVMEVTGIKIDVKLSGRKT